MFLENFLPQTRLLPQCQLDQAGCKKSGRGGQRFPELRESTPQHSSLQAAGRASVAPLVEILAP